MVNVILKKKNNFTYGFTLIELLVVISIISLLSTVVMASLQTARAKAQEAAIKTDLQSIKTQAELSYSKLGNYSSVASEIAPILAHINANGGAAGFYATDNSHYAVSVKFNSDISKNWSVSDTSNVGVWDISDQSSTLSWSNAKITCENLGKRLPTLEELKALREVYGILPPGFVPGGYWASTPYLVEVDTEVLITGWYVNMSNGDVGYDSEGGGDSLVRCVK